MVPGDERAQKQVGKAPRRPDVDRLRRTLEAYMERRGLRSTEQRRLIASETAIALYGIG